MFVVLNLYPLNQPEVMIAHAEDKFDSEGNLIDQKAAQKLRELLEALTERTKSLQKAKSLR
jgi:chromate reductase